MPALKSASAKSNALPSNAISVNPLELVGWAGGPGFTPSVVFKRPMEISECPITGLIQAECRGIVDAPDHIAQSIPGHVGRWNDPSRRDKMVYALAPGTIFRFSREQVRLAI